MTSGNIVDNVQQQQQQQMSGWLNEHNVQELSGTGAQSQHVHVINYDNNNGHQHFVDNNNVSVETSDYNMVTEGLAVGEIVIHSEMKNQKQKIKQ